MKILTTIALLALITGCSTPEKRESISMPGAYKMLYLKVKGGKTDTSFTSLLQQKIYTDEFMMYANFNPVDSVSNFGVGSYTFKSDISTTGKVADTVIEHVFYNGADTSKSETLHNFKLLIEKTATGYQQIIPEIESAGEKYMMTEEYENIGTATTSALDGVWKQDKAIYIKGKDTTKGNTTQFKVYHAGHFIWGHTYADSTGKTHTGIGFGTFTMTSADKLKEVVTVSTYADARGHDFDIALEMTGADAFKQTITNADSTKQVETYTRLKK